jgi:uncharacterized coiled-coil protein SlyX
MVEPIPFMGWFDADEPESYLREQIGLQQRRIDELMAQTYELQEALTKAQVQIDALSVPGLWEHRDSAMEMSRNPDGSFTLKPIKESEA